VTGVATHLVWEVLVHVRRVPIRLKLGATLLVPVVALVVVAGLEMASAADERREVHDQAELATATLGPPSLLLNIELERNAAATYLLGQEDAVALSVENKEEAWAESDAAIEDFRAMVSSKGGSVAENYGPALDALAGLGDLRATVSEYTGERSLNNNPLAREVFDGYSEIMNRIYAANAVVVPTIANSDLRRGAELADLSAHQRDLTARVLRELLRAQFEGAKDGINESAEVSGLARVLGALRRNAAAIRTKADGPYAELADELFAKDHIKQYPELIQETIDTGVIDIGKALNTSTGNESGEFGYTVFSKQVNEQLLADADAVRADADARFRMYGLLGLLAVALALATTFLVSRSLTRPLRSLTRQATDMAGERLPNAVRSILNTPLGEDVEIPEVEPVRVKTRDEVGDVADALNTVQETALELAVEQAVLRRNIADSFVNLGRRNQNLLGRQLDFITELESNETDPDTLASLFRLDHLATRMRRNAESLLVLAGIDPPRRWSAPVRLNDVIRAALGEVEDYQRVSVLGVEPATVVGSAAADLAHLIAEFIENALTFSPPDQKVEVRGRHLEGGYTLAIIDNGFGMAPEDIERANRRLAGSESFTVAPSKYLGHYVAGNLAARHEVTVRLEQSPGSGVTAIIHLSPELVAGAEVGGTVEGEAVASVPLPAEGRNGRLLGSSAVGASDNGGGTGHLVGAGNGNGNGSVPPLMPTLNTGPVPLAPGLDSAGAGAARPAPQGLDAPGLPPAAPRLGAPGGLGPGPAGLPAAGLSAVGPSGADDQPLGPERTASGLTKRSPRSPATAAAVPHGELLDALSRHSRNAGGGPVGLPPAAPQLPAAGPDRPRLPSRTPGGDAGRGLPGRTGAVPDLPHVAGGGYVPTPPGTHQGPAGPRPPLERRTPASGPAAAGGPGRPDAARPAGQGWAALADLATPRRPTRPQPAGGEAPVMTSSGLARRVPGANLPSTGPLGIRRGDPTAEPPAPGPSAVVPGPPPTVPVAERPEGQRHERAESVYSLLTNFTSGVQRGLDESASGAPPARPDGPQGRP
jgi:signal transduction histidine kinase